MYLYEFERHSEEFNIAENVALKALVHIKRLFLWQALLEDRGTIIKITMLFHLILLVCVQIFTPSGDISPLRDPRNNGKMLS